jgi:hypothetical protein
MTTNRWTKDQVKLAFHLYCQLPYGRIYGRNPEIMALSQVIGRTADAVAMKMLNIASIDPAITSTGRVGLGNASALDREVWEEFHADWDRFVIECHEQIPPTDYTGRTKPVLTQQRIKQNFFRRAVLSSYRSRCCMSGVSEPRLLVASHIVPWSKDAANRLNPSNGLCLSAIHDRAFDQGLISLTDDFKVIVSSELKRRDDPFTQSTFSALEGHAIELPERFEPGASFAAWHRRELFLDNRK